MGVLTSKSPTARTFVLLGSAKVVTTKFKTKLTLVLSQLSVCLQSSSLASLPLWSGGVSGGHQKTKKTSLLEVSKHKNSHRPPQLSLFLSHRVHSQSPQSKLCLFFSCTIPLLFLFRDTPHLFSSSPGRPLSRRKNP